MRPFRPPGLLFGCVATTFGAYALRLIPHDNFTAIMADIGGQVDQGYAENVHGYASTWLRGPNGRRTITYCYNDYFIRDQFQEYVEGAVKLWADALGQPGSDNGHCVEFKEFTPSNGESEFCRDDDENWHDHVPADALELLIDQREGIVGTTSSTIGYDTDTTVPGRHQLFFDPDLIFNSDAGSDDSFIFTFDGTAIASTQWIVSVGQWLGLTLTPHLCHPWSSAPADS